MMRFGRGAHMIHASHRYHNSSRADKNIVNEIDPVCGMKSILIKITAKCLKEHFASFVHALASTKLK